MFFFAKKKAVHLQSYLDLSPLKVNSSQNKMTQDSLPHAYNLSIQTQEFEAQERTDPVSTQYQMEDRHTGPYLSLLN